MTTRLAELNRRDRLKTTLQTVKNRLRSILPDGCPAVIGGGVVRDGIMGGQPNDIDVWLPSNINITSTQDLRVWCEGVFQSNTQVIFSGPENVEQEGEGYRDMSNHCVLEFNDLRGFKINIMRTMTQWSNDDPSAFFRGVMRNFDIDLCMFFVAFGYETIGIHTPHVIMPRHLVAQLNDTTGVTNRIRQFCWNLHRLENMSDARMDMREAKMYSKFQDLGPAGRIPVSEIEPQVVTVSWLMTKIHFFPMPVIAAVPGAPTRVTMELSAHPFVGISIGRVGRLNSELNTRTLPSMRGQGHTVMYFDDVFHNPEVSPEEDPNAEPLAPPPQITARQEEFLRTSRPLDWS